MELRGRHGSIVVARYHRKPSPASGLRFTQAYRKDTLVHKTHISHLPAPQ
jgi:hypothetical protein